jgi:hypothetical protein
MGPGTLAVWCSLLCGPLDQGAVPAGDVGSPAVGHVALLDGHHIVPGGLREVGRALQEELRRSGVEITWTAGDEPVPQAPLQLKVTFLPHVASDWGLPRDALATVPKEGNDLIVFVFFPAVEAILRVAPSKTQSILRRRAPAAKPWPVGVARIIQHEMVHALLRGREHDAVGLFSARLTAEMLLGSSLDLSARTRAAMHERLDVGPALTATSPPASVAGTDVRRREPRRPLLQALPEK